MNDIQFADLVDVEETQLLDLMNNKQVGALMPLLVNTFSRADCRAFVKAKQQLWRQHGYGPWAFIINGEFAGWGGLQPEHGEADFALVLHPRFRGWGRRIFNKVREHAFDRMNLCSITILLPPIRSNARAIKRLGFVEDGYQVIDGETFEKFRLVRPGP